MADEEQAQARPSAEAAPTGGRDGAAPRGRSGTWVVVLVGIAVVILTPAATYLVMRKTMNEPMTPAAAHAASAEHATHSLGEIYVNIAETKGTRILKMEPVLILSEARMKDALTAAQPVLRDRVLAIAGAKTIEDLERSESREAMKRDIMEAINAAVRKEMAGSVIDVCFNEFLIQ
jgi:flagellar basal body-associated protein FliL